MKKKTRLTVPGDHRFGRGWMLGKLDGRDSFTDGCALFVGKPPKGETCKIKDSSISAVLRDARLKRLTPTKVHSRKNNGAYDMVILNGGVAIQEVYYNFLRERFPHSKLYLGKKTRDKSSRYVFGVDESGIVALIMPVRL